MRLYTLHIDNKTEVVESTEIRLRKAMWSFIKTERAKGRGLASIVFCWSPISTRRI